MSKLFKVIAKWFRTKRREMVIRNNGYNMYVDRNEAIRKNWHIIKRLNDMGKKDKTNE